jgi:CRP-like cAMP-binding protein
MQKVQTNVPNKLLSSLPRAEFRRLVDQLEVVSLTQGQVLSDFGRAPSHVYFPTSAVVSLWTPVDSDKKFAVGLVGREGLVNVVSALDPRNSQFQSLVQCPGQAMRMKIRSFVDEFHASETLNRRVTQCLAILLVQIARTAGCNGVHLIEQRVAHWLLMMRDRLSSDEFFITHEMLGQLIGGRRVGITNVAASFKERKLIDYSRGYFTIVDRNGLRHAACSCYQPLHSESDPT